MSQPSKNPHACTACGGDAFIGYSSGQDEQAWGGKVKKGERLCTRCFQARGGENFFAKPKQMVAR